ncbi:50S ribosomal protein L23 [Patescibacteria group bacterium]
MSLFGKKKEIKPDVKQVAKKTVIINKQASWVYNIIKSPHITEKATDLAEKNKYVFNVYTKANKPEIKKAIKALYNVSVKNVNLIHMPSKKRRMGKSQGYRHGLEKGYKKAIITIAKGEKIDIMPR